MIHGLVSSLLLLIPPFDTIMMGLFYYKESHIIKKLIIKTIVSKESGN